MTWPADPVSIFHLARSPAHPLRQVRHAAALEAKRQIALLKALDLSNAGEHDHDLVDRWLEELRRHAAEPR
jgi:hypothetical protein